MKRRSVDMPASCWEMGLAAKRHSSITLGSNGAAAFGSAVPTSASSQTAAFPALGGKVVEMPVTGGEARLWMAVAAQVEAAMSALPGWVHVTTRGAQGDQGATSDLMSPSSGVSTPYSTSYPAQPQPTSALGLHQMHAFTASGRPSSHCSSAAFVAAPTGHPAVSQPSRALEYTQQRSCVEGLSESICTSGTSGASSMPDSSSSALPRPRTTSCTASAHAPEQPATAAPTASAEPGAGAGADSTTSDMDTAGVEAFGWFAKCRGCCCMTAGEMELHGHAVPLCRGCAGTLSKRTGAEHEHLVVRILRADAALKQRERALAQAHAVGC